MTLDPKQLQEWGKAAAIWGSLIIGGLSGLIGLWQGSAARHEVHSTATELYKTSAKLTDRIDENEGADLSKWIDIQGDLQNLQAKGLEP